jgi:hypothetical protein
MRLLQPPETAVGRDAVEVQIGYSVSPVCLMPRLSPLKSALRRPTNHDWSGLQSEYDGEAKFVQFDTIKGERFDLNDQYKNQI